jgi:hypothetical protein
MVKVPERYGVARQAGAPADSPLRVSGKYWIESSKGCRYRTFAAAAQTLRLGLALRYQLGSPGRVEGPQFGH